MRKIGPNTILRVLINGIGVYCRVRDIASDDIRLVLCRLTELNAEKRVHGIAMRIGENNIQIDL